MPSFQIAAFLFCLFSPSVQSADASCKSNHDCALLSPPWEPTTFCSSKTKTCTPCNQCAVGKDAVGGKCPQQCIPAVGSSCDGHHHCDADSTFLHGHHVVFDSLWFSVVPVLFKKYSEMHVRARLWRVYNLNCSFHLSLSRILLND